MRRVAIVVAITVRYYLLLLLLLQLRLMLLLFSIATWLGLVESEQHVASLAVLHLHCQVLHCQKYSYHPKRTRVTRKLLGILGRRGTKKAAGAAAHTESDDKAEVAY